MPDSSISTNQLSYTFPDDSTGLKDVKFSLPPRSRALLIGANGSGKTTLLRLLSGKRLAPAGSIKICGVDPFTEGLEGVAYLGVEWVLNPVVRTDIDVPALLASVGGDFFPERRDELVEILDVDLAWRMHAVSDGERRRVQLAMGLLRPWTVLLLDEVTVDLDLLTRHNFIDFLKRETESRDCTIVYATHILDGSLAQWPSYLWPSHLIHMHQGTVREWGSASSILQKRQGSTNNPLGDRVLEWLRQDLADRGPRTSKQ